MASTVSSLTSVRLVGSSAKGVRFNRVETTQSEQAISFITQLPQSMIMTSKLARPTDTAALATTVSQMSSLIPAENRHVVAFLVLGADGSSTINGSSVGLTTHADRASFLASRRAFDSILIGGRSAALESYSKTPVPLIVLSRSRPDVLDRNPKALWWNCPPSEAVERAALEYGPAVCVEGGVNFLADLLNQGAVDELRLSVTPIEGGEDKADIHDLISQFSHLNKRQIEDTTFYTCSSPKIRKQK